MPVRLTVPVLVLMALSGCASDGFPAGLALRDASASRGLMAGLLRPDANLKQVEESRALSKVRLARGDVVVAPPSGYCVDPASLGNTPRSSFALIGSCQALNESASGQAVPPVVMTVTVGARGAQTLPDATSLADQKGAAVLGNVSADQAVVTHLSKGGDVHLSGGDPRHWRGAAEINGRLVGVALYAPQGADAAGQAGGAIVAGLLASIKAESPAGRPLVQARANMRAPTEDSAGDARPTPRIASEFRRVWSRLTAP